MIISFIQAIWQKIICIKTELQYQQQQQKWNYKTKTKKTSGMLSTQCIHISCSNSHLTWVATPTGQVFRWHFLIMVQPRTISGAVLKPNSSAPRSAATTTSWPANKEMPVGSYSDSNLVLCAGDKLQDFPSSRFFKMLTKFSSVL